MVSVKEKYGFLPTSVWHLNKKHPINEMFKDRGDAHRKRRGSGSFLPNLKFSSFNPNVVERVLKYWTEKGDTIFDPFAGRTTRGLVSLYMDRKYIGCEVSPTTCELTKKELDKMEKDYLLLNEDGCKKHNQIKEESCDLVFTCPPYWKLERYEHCENQLSDCKTYKDFLEKIGDSIEEGNRILKENKFSIWVCSDWRNAGFYCFHQDIINLHLERGFVLWDIIINVLNSPFVYFKAGFNDKYKYTGKTHEYILVFKKVLSKSSPPVRTSNSTSLTSDKPKGFNMGLEVPTSSPPKSPTATSPNPNIRRNSDTSLAGLVQLKRGKNLYT